MLHIFKFTLLLLLSLISLNTMVMAQSPRLILPIGHSNSIKTVEFSKDEKKVLTTSRDGTVKIWEVESGKLLGTLEGHTAEITSATFNGDGSQIVTASFDGTARIWDTESGKELLKIVHGKAAVLRASFNLTGDAILTTDGMAKIWDAKTGKLKMIFYDQYRINNTYFSGDGRFVITHDDYRMVKAWPAVLDRPLSPLEQKIVDQGKPLVINQGWQAIQYGDIQAQFGIKPQDNLTYELGRYALSVDIFNKKTAQKISTLKGISNQIKELVINEKGSTFALLKAGDSTFTIWDIKTGQLLKIGEKMNNQIIGISYSPNGQYVAAHTREHTKIFAASSGYPIAEFNGQFGQFNDDGKTLIIGINAVNAQIVNIEDGKTIMELNSPDSSFKALSFSKDGSKVFSTALAKKSDPGSRVYHLRYVTKVWDATTGKIIAAFHPTSFSYTLFNPLGTALLSTDSLNRIWISNALNSKKITELKLTNKPQKIEIGELTAAPNNYFDLISAVFSADGNTIITISIDQKLRYWDANNGKIRQEYIFEGINYSSTIAFSPDHRYLMLNAGLSLKIIDYTNGSLVASLDGHTAKIIAAHWYPTGNYLVTAANDGTIKLWHTKTFQLLYTFVPIKENDYLVMDKEGRYDGTHEGRKLVYLVCGSEIIELDQVKEQLWVPGLTAHIMAGDQLTALGISQVNVCNLVPAVEVEQDGDNGYKFKIKPGKGGLGESILYLNDIEFKRYKVNQLLQTVNGYELKISLAELGKLIIPGKENNISLKALAASNTISSRGVKVLYEAKDQAVQAPNLYAVIIGVSDYKTNSLTLKYAAKDATDIAKVITASAKKLLNTDGNEHVFTYNLITTPKDLQSGGKIAIQNALTDIGKKAKPSDLLLIFFAGHGAMDGETKRFYLLTSDVASADNFKENGISTTELSEWMKPESIKAQKRILIFDACNSGQAINDLVKIGNNNQQYLAARGDNKAQQIKAIEKLNEKSGFFILSAAASNQSAYEMGKYSQGLLTYALLKTIKEQPNILENNKYLNVGNWFSATEQLVSDLAKENGARQQPQVISMSNFNIGIVDQDLINTIKLPQEKTLFTTSNFQNSSEAIADDDLELSKIVNQYLNTISTKGTTSINYVAGTSSSDAYTLGGRYDVKADAITTRVNIKKGKEIVYRFEVAGKKTDLNALVAQLVKQATDWIANSAQKISKQ